MSFVLATKGRGVSVGESRATQGILSKAGVFTIISAIKTFYRESITTTHSAAVKVDSFTKTTISKTADYIRKITTFDRDKIQ